MKKLLFLAFFFLLFSENVGAQNRKLSNSISVLVAPNLVYQLPIGPLKNNKYDPGLGYNFGLDYTRKFSKSWHYGIGLRYNCWKSSTAIGDLTYESEWATGVYVYDPTLQHKIVFKHTDKSWQLLTGAGFHSKPKLWRWNANLELGLTMFTKGTMGGTNVTRLTTGISLGLERVLNHRFHLFMEPGTRFVFNKLKKSDFAGNRFLVYHLETGLGFSF